MSEDNYSAVYYRADNLDDVMKMCGSKYIQAEMGESYKEVKCDLSKGKSVLFSGTSCQINGLKCFLSQEYDNLTCVDIICHGVPSCDLWKAYLIEREKTIGKCTSISFRSKESGWYDSSVMENTFYTEQKKHSYMRLFLQDYCLRPSCYSCVAKKSKMSDITIGDFWGVKSISPDIDDDRGISVIILRSERGKKLLEFSEKDLVLRKITYQEAIEDNPSENTSPLRPWQREHIYIDLKRRGYPHLAKKYLGSSLIWKVIRRIERHLVKR